jgi:ornithine carbamoyltransferase
MTLVDLHGRDLISSQDWSVEEIEAAMELARSLKISRAAGNVPELFQEQNHVHAFLQHVHEDEGEL